MNKREAEAVERLRKFVLERRHRLNFRQQDVVDHAGISIGWIGMLESGKLKSQPRKDTLMKLVKGLSLPDEHPGTLYNFLELVMAGTVDAIYTRHVANGKKPLAEAMKDLLEGRGLSEVVPGEEGIATELFFNRQLRSDHLETILALLKMDLHPYDFELLSKLIERFYEDAPVSPDPLPPRSAPRRRPPRRNELP